MILFISGLLHLGILFYAWNLKLGEYTSISFLAVMTGLSFLINTLMLLEILGIFSLSFKTRKNYIKVPEESISEENLNTFLIEYTDPKISAEKIFKNILLQKNICEFGEKILTNLSDEFEMVQGVFYFLNRKSKLYEPKAFYAITDTPAIGPFAPGEGISGEAARKAELTVVKNLPEDYRRIESGLGGHAPKFLYLIPIFSDQMGLALIEMSTFTELQENKLNVLNYFIHLGGDKLNQFLEINNE